MNAHEIEHEEAYKQVKSDAGYFGNQEVYLEKDSLGIRIASGEDAIHEDQEFQRIEKQSRYTGEDGKDLIDKWAERYSPEEFRLIMLAMIEKYMTRMNKKDHPAKECRKIADFANRLAIVEESR